MASLMSLLTGHRPGAFRGFKMGDLFDKERWDRMPRTWSGQRTPTGPTDIRTNRAGEPMMTNWYRGRNQDGGEAAHTQHAMANLPSPVYQGPNTQGYSEVRALSPNPQIREEKLPLFRNPFRNPESQSTRYNVTKTSYAPYGGSIRSDQMGGGLVAPPLDIATEEEVEAMNAYRSQMLSDLLAETSEEPEVKAISYYKKKKRSPKTYRSQSRGYRLKRI